MKSSWTVWASLILLVVIAWSSWEIWRGRTGDGYGGRAARMTGLGEELVRKYDGAALSSADLTSGAAELRLIFDELNFKGSAEDRRRPSFRKLERLAQNVEAAAQTPDRPEVVRARMVVVKEVVTELRAELGTDRDRPE